MLGFAKKVPLREMGHGGGFTFAVENFENFVGFFALHKNDSNDDTTASSFAIDFACASGILIMRTGRTRSAERTEVHL